MSEAIGASVGSIAVAAPAVGAGIGPSMGGEMSMSGIGFDGGSPTFSGLGRSDSGLGAFSVNEGSKGPVSFSNSTDLFAETRAFTPSLGTVPEGPVKGNIFSSDVVTIAESPNLEPVKAPQEKASIFDGFEEFQPTIPVNEGPVPFLINNNFISTGIDKITPEIEPEFEAEQELSVEDNLETFASTEAEALGIQTKTVTDAIEDMRANDPLTYMQLESDLRLVQNIVDLAVEEADPEVSTAISNTAINVAVERSGLIHALEQIEHSEEPESQTETETDPMNANVQAITDAITALPEAKVKQRQAEIRPEYFVDEKANSARRTETAQAIKVAFEEDIDPQTGKVSGKAIIDRLPVDPADETISEIRLKEGSKSDGSESQRRADWALRDLDSIEEAYGVNEELITKNNAVTDEEASKRATLDEAAKVRRGVKARISETQIFPLAA